MADDAAAGLSMSDTEPTGSIAALFLAANRELAKSDARIYRSVDRHLRRARQILAREEAGDREQRESQSLRIFADTHRLLQGAPSYERQPRRALEQLCRQHAIRGYSRMSKALMIAQLKAKGVEAPPVPLQAFSKAELLELIEGLTATK